MKILGRKSRFAGNSLILSTILVMAGLVLSKASGFLRDIFVGIKFSDSVYRDSFTLAFSIPDLVYNLLIGGSIQSAITPSLSASIAAGEEKKGIRAVSIFISFFALLLIFVCTLGVIFSPQIYSIFSDGDTSEQIVNLAANASRWLFPQIVFMMLAALCIGILNAYKRFESTSFGPTIYNTFVLIAIIAFAGNSLPQLMHTTCGIMGAAIIYFAYQYIVGRDKLRAFRFIWAPGDKDFHALVRRALPILISASVVQINMVILNYFAIRLPDSGYIYALRNASTTWQLPYGIFAVAIGNVMLPSLAECYGKGDFKGASDLISSRIKSALFLTIPSAGIMAVLNLEVIKAIFQWNSAYREIDAIRAGQLLTGYSIAIITHSVVFIMNQAFYAIGKTRVPLMAGCIGLISNPVCCILLIPSLGAMGLTLSYSITSILQMTLLCIVYCSYKEIRPRHMLGFTLKCISSMLIMCVVATFINLNAPVAHGKINELISVAVKVLGSGIIYIGATLILRVPESRQFLNSILGKFRKSK